jgi:hypothetical protein
MPIGSLWSEPNYAYSSKAIRAAKRSGLLRNLEIFAFDREDDRLSHTIHLPDISEKKVRQLLGAKTREVILGCWPLKAKQLAAFQVLIELEFEPNKFEYQFNGDAILGFKESLKSARYWREVDATLRLALRQAAEPHRPSRDALDHTYQRLRALMTRASIASSYLPPDKT